MILGIDASRANLSQRTGTEWYAYFLIKHFNHIVPPDVAIRLYTKEQLLTDMGPLSSQVGARTLTWPPKFLWSQLRLSLEMAARRPDALFVPAHTIPYIHPPVTLTTLHDVGFERFPDAYDARPIAHQGRVVKTVLDMFIRLVSLGKYRNTELDYHRFSARFAVARARRIITVSEFSKREIVSVYRCNPSKISVIHNGFDDSVFMSERSLEAEKNLHQQFGIADDYIISVGRLELKKNTDRMVEAFARVKKRLPAPNLKLVLIGAPGYGFSKVQKAITANGVGEHVVMPGWLDVPSYAHLLRGAKAFFFPSLYEGFGIPLLEAMACGVPILTSNISSMPEVCGAAAVYADPLSIEDLSRGLERLVGDERLQRSLIEKGYQRAREFSWKKCARETLDVILNEMRDSRVPRP